ncbi:toxic anion resistance protein [Enterovibrio sp. Hal110]
MTELTNPQSQVLDVEVTPQIVALAEQFDAFDTVATITFGKGALEKITAFSDEVLEQVRVRDSGEAGDILHAMVSSMDSAEFDNLGKKSLLSRLPLVGELLILSKNSRRVLIR